MYVAVSHPYYGFLLPPLRRNLPIVRCHTSNPERVDTNNHLTLDTIQVPFFLHVERILCIIFEPQSPAVTKLKSEPGSSAIVSLDRSDCT